MGVTIGEYCTAMMKRRGCYISWCFQFLQIVDGLAVTRSQGGCSYFEAASTAPRAKGPRSADIENRRPVWGGFLPGMSCHFSTTLGHVEGQRVEVGGPHDGPCGSLLDS